MLFFFLEVGAPETLRAKPQTFCVRCKAAKIKDKTFGSLYIFSIGAHILWARWWKCDNSNLYGLFVFSSLLFLTYEEEPLWGISRHRHSVQVFVHQMHFTSCTCSFK